MKKSLTLFSILIGVFLFVSSGKAQIIKNNYRALKWDGHLVHRYDFGEGNDWNVLLAEDGNIVHDDHIYNNGVKIQADIVDNKWYDIVRSIFPFNTTSIPENAIIESAKLHIFVGTKEDDGLNANLDWNIYAAHPATTSSLTESDFGKFGSIPFSTTKTWDETEWYSEQIFDLNEAGIAHINKGGFTSFGVRNATYDAGGVEPNWVSKKRAYINFYFSDNEDESKHAYLEVTYKEATENNTIEPLILIPGIMGSWPVGDLMALDPILHTYDNLWQAFLMAGYQEGVNLFAFAYDWRQPNTYTAELLKSKIASIKIQTGHDKVDLVAHSMGGLVARSYIEGAGYQDDIDQLIFLATPHRGAPQAYLAWEGAKFGNDLWDEFKERLFELEAIEHYHYGPNKLFRYIRSMESVRELLPVYDYLSNNRQSILRTYPNNYPRNHFLEILNLPSAVNRLSSVNVVNIAARQAGEQTIQGFVVRKAKQSLLWEHGIPVHYYSSQSGIIRGVGDGTVPQNSNINFVDHDIVMNSDHRHIVSDAQQEVIYQLNGQRPDFVVDKKFKDLILVRVMSPVDFLLIDPLGRKLGKDFIARENINEIEDAFYSGFVSQTEFASIVNPQTGEYNLELQGVDNGSYKLVISYLGVDKTLDKEITGHVKSGENIKITFNFTSEHNLTLINRFDQVLADLEDLNNNGEINNKYVYRIIKQKLKILNSKYIALQSEDREWKIKLTSRIIKFRLKILKSHLNFYKYRHWLSRNAYGVLKKDMQSLINML